MKSDVREVLGIYVRELCTLPRRDPNGVSQQSTGRSSTTVLHPKGNSPADQKHRDLREVSSVPSQKKVAKRSKPFLLF